MLQFNHGGLEAEPPWLQDSVSTGPQPPAGPHMQSCACLHKAAQVFQYVACSSWLSPSASLGKKGLKSLINPVASSSSNCYRKENVPLNQRQKFLNFWGLALIWCLYDRMLDPHLCFSPNNCRILKMAGSWEGCGDSSTLSLQGR